METSSGPAATPAAAIPSEETAKPYIEAGGVSGRTAVYKDAEIQKSYPFVAPMVASWDGGVPDFRPRFAEWPEISEVVAEWGTRMMLGNVSVQQGAQSIGARVEEILGQAGYYDGSKPLRK